MLVELRDRSGGSFTKASPSVFENVYQSLPKISIDHAVLEISNKVAVVPAAIGWQDIGSCDAIARGFTSNAEGNNLFGDVLALECNGTTIDSDGPFVAAIGLNDQVVVVSGGAVLVTALRNVPKSIYSGSYAPGLA